MFDWECGTQLLIVTWSVVHRDLTQRQFVYSALTHWGRVTHICVSKLTIIGPNNGFSPGRRQAIIWTNAAILSNRPFGTNFSEISIELHILSFKKIHLKMSSGIWRPFCLGLNVLTHLGRDKMSNILQTVFSNYFSIKTVVFRLKFHGNLLYLITN